ncbi:hypothetical protein ACH50O_11530 [Methylomonas sp. 2BW1-5-20]|uniref:hypothetical protein n=1 Tax=Methylomonas sp. 2BW1-5-20 TaxID=3376686 RepID=UPI00404EA1ED
MQLSEMQLQEANEEKFDQIKVAWLDLLQESNHDVFKAEYTQLFDTITAGKSWGALDERFNVPIYQVIEGEDKVWAIVNIVQSRQGSSTWIKLMDIYMSPEIDTSTDNEINTTKRLEVFTTALGGIFALTKNVNNANKLKIYGRTDVLVAFLRGMHDVFSTINAIGTIRGVETSIEGRWLVFSPC